MSEEDYSIEEDLEETKKCLKEANEEIERLNKERETDIKYNKYLQKELAKANSIIKEVREYIEYQLENLDFEEDAKAKMLGAMVLVLLDKEK